MYEYRPEGDVVASGAEEAQYLVHARQPKLQPLASISYDFPVQGVESS